jgi:SOS-response transcriptional repressor LexA
MRKRAWMSRSAATLVAVLLHGCASGNSNLVRLDVGRATRPDIIDKAPRILDRQGYEIVERRDTGNAIEYMTSWITRAPFEDEERRGAAECRTRLTFEARKGAGDTYAVRLSAENMMLRTGFDGSWVAMSPTPMFRRHLEEVSDALALEIDMGVRTR